MSNELPQASAAFLRRHREMLVITCLIVVLSFLFEVRDDDRVFVHGLPDWPLPPTCLTYQWFGVKCPGCGLTRSFVHLAHGNLAASWQLHRLGWLIAMAVLLQFPYRLWALSHTGKPPLGLVIPKLFGYTLIALLILNWLWDVFRAAGFGI